MSEYETYKLRLVAAGGTAHLAVETHLESVLAHAAVEQLDAVEDLLMELLR